MRDYGAEAGARRDYSGGLTALQCSTERGYGAEAGAWRDYSGGLAALQCGMSFLKVAGAKSHGTKKRPIRHNKKIFTAFSLTPREIPNNVFFSKHPTGSSLRFATFSENGSFFECRIVHNFLRSLTITSNYLDVSRGSRVPQKQVFHTFLEIVRKLKHM